MASSLPAEASTTFLRLTLASFDRSVRVHYRSSSLPAFPARRVLHFRHCLFFVPRPPQTARETPVATKSLQGLFLRMKGSSVIAIAVSVVTLLGIISYRFFSAWWARALGRRVERIRARRIAEVIALSEGAERPENGAGMVPVTP